MKKTLSSLVQPVIVLIIILFWMFAPAAWVKNSWTVTAMVVGTKILIQSFEFFFERHASWRMNRTEFLTDLFYVGLGFFVISKISKFLVKEPLVQVKHYLGINTEWATHLPFLAQVAIIIFLIEFGQYWMHRLMHNNAFFWSTHAPHHHITQLNAWKGAVGNPLELFLVGLSVVALFDFQMAALFCAGNVLTSVTSFAHANVRFNPPRWFAYVFTTIKHHSIHHSVVYEETRSNYANALILIDRVFGTFRDGEAEIVGLDDRRRLSIREQFLFPLLPLIATIKAKRNKAAPAIN